MTFEEPTYEEYKAASGFARFKYKYGLFVLIANIICFVLLMYFIISYGEELASDPMSYAMSKKPGLECHCYRPDQLKNDIASYSKVDFYMNDTNRWIESQGQEPFSQQEVSDILKDFDW